MTQLIALAAAYGIFNAVSIALTGNRALLAGNFFTPRGLLALVTNWRFVLAMLLAVCTRFVFVWMNRSVVFLPGLASSATTVTALVTALSYPVILGVNAVMLGERFSGSQLVGTGLIMTGIYLSCMRPGS